MALRPLDDDGSRVSLNYSVRGAAAVEIAEALAVPFAKFCEGLQRCMPSPPAGPPTISIHDRLLKALETCCGCIPDHEVDHNAKTPPAFLREKPRRVIHIDHSPWKAWRTREEVEEEILEAEFAGVENYIHSKNMAVLDDVTARETRHLHKMLQPYMLQGQAAPFVRAGLETDLISILSTVENTHAPPMSDMDSVERLSINRALTHREERQLLKDRYPDERWPRSIELDRLAKMEKTERARSARAAASQLAYERAGGPSPVQRRLNSKSGRVSSPDFEHIQLSAGKWLSPRESHLSSSARREVRL